MARGNWNPDVIKPKPRCLLCARVVTTKDMVRLNGISPAHRQCAIDRNRQFTDGADIHKEALGL
jgi:hypothetical protein